MPTRVRCLARHLSCASGLAGLLLVCQPGECTAAAATSVGDRAVEASLQTIQQCLAQLPEETRSRPVEQCPELAGAMHQLGLGIGLGPGWEKLLTRRSLQDLLSLGQRYRGAAPGTAPSLTMLPQVLRELRAGQRGRSWWEDLKERLRQLLAASSATDSSWMTRLLSAVPRLALRVLIYGTLAAVLAFALWILWKELLAELVAARRGGGKLAIAAIADAPALNPLHELSLAEIESAPAGERAGLLLQLLLQALRRAGRLPLDRALTCRELSEQARLDGIGQRERFIGVARWAERERYGQAVPPTAPVSRATILQQGRELYAELAAAPAPTTEAAQQPGGAG